MDATPNGVAKPPAEMTQLGPIAAKSIATGSQRLSTTTMRATEIRRGMGAQ